MRELTKNVDAHNGPAEDLTPDETSSPEPQLSPVLTPAEFRSVLDEIDRLGLTWTSDLPPTVVARDGTANGAFATEKFDEIEERYPTLPNELGYVIWYALTGTEPVPHSVGSEEDLQAKAAIVRETIITPAFQDDFLFRHMLKLPRFENVEWEVIVKTSESGVQRFPGNAYGLVSILLESNSPYGDENESFTFAVNASRLTRLITVLDEMRDALHRATNIGECLKRSIDAPD